MTATIDTDTDTQPESTTDAPAVTPLLGLTTREAVSFGYPTNTPVLVFEPEPGHRAEGVVMLLSRMRGGYTPRARHLGGLNHAQHAWVMEVAERHVVTLTWNQKNFVRILGPLPNAERMLEEGGEDWAYSQVPAMVDRQIRALEARVATGLREKKEEHEWCSELENDWLPQMDLPAKAVRAEVTHRTFEVEFEFEATATVSQTVTVTVPIDGEGDDLVRYRAVEQAEEQAREDLRSEVDFAVYGCARSEVTYEPTATSVVDDFDSDEDGERVDD